MKKLVVISGPSGVGKGTIVKLLKEKYLEENKKLYVSVSCTTRLPREGEEDGKDYYFITEDEFQEKINNNGLLEYNQYGTGKFYGTPKDKVLDYLNNDYDVILEIDINGFRQIKSSYPDAIGIFIMPPSIDDLYTRLRNRKTESEEIIENRINTAKGEIANKDIFDYIIINPHGDSREATDKIYGIMNN